MEAAERQAQARIGSAERAFANYRAQLEARMAAKQQSAELEVMQATAAAQKAAQQAAQQATEARCAEIELVWAQKVSVAASKLAESEALAQQMVRCLLHVCAPVD